MIDSKYTRNPSNSGHPDGNAIPNSAPDSASRKTLWIWRVLIFILPVLVIIAAIAAFAAMGALKPQPDEKTEDIKAIPVLISAVKQDNITLTVNVQGEVQPRTEINLVPQVTGLITYMSPKFIEGGQFKRGDLLVRIDPAEFELRVTQAQANVAQAETAVTRETSESVIARQDWDELGRTGEPTPLTLRVPQMAEAKAQLASAKARLAEAELQLSRTSLYAPFDGRVTMRHVDQGEFVTAGSKLGEIYAVDIMDVRLPMTNEDLRRAGLTLGFEADGKTPGISVALSANVAGAQSQWQGRIVRTDSRFDATTRVLHAYAEVRDPFGAGASDGTPLAPGIFVNAAIDGQDLENMMVIPRAGLRGDDKVYIAKDGLLSIQTVSVMSSDRDTAIISDGLTLDDKVITSPIRGVADGMRIEVVTPGMASSGQSSAEGDE